ncbi:MAG: dihydrolipoyl dehydrogenase family protein [Enterococcus sp.]
MEKYDVVIIGSGVGGLTAAYALHAVGKSVAVIENNLWGGTCPNRGCDPKKVLLSGVEARDRVNQLQKKGFNELPPMKWKEIEAFKRTFTDPVSDSRKSGFAAAGIMTFEGTATFIDETHIQVDEQIIEGKQFLLATGQRPALLPIEGKEYLKTSTDFLSLAEMPKTVVFIGGGYISFELATIAQAAGANVHIIHHNQKPLKAFDASLVKELVKQVESRGITVHLDTEVKKITKKEKEYFLELTQGTLVTDLVFSAAGRIPNCEELHLENAHVVYDAKGILVDTYLRTTNPAIYACGDVLKKNVPKLTPVAIFEAAYVAKVMSDEVHEPIHYPSIPTIVYGSPKLAQVGVTTQEAEKSSLYTIERKDMTDWFTYSRINEPIAQATLIYTAENKLVGASLLSSQADELINYLALVIDQKITSKQIEQMIMGYPTVASDLDYLL